MLFKLFLFYAPTSYRSPTIYKTECNTEEQQRDMCTHAYNFHTFGDISIDWTNNRKLNKKWYRTVYER